MVGICCRDFVELLFPDLGNYFDELNVIIAGRNKVVIN